LKEAASKELRNVVAFTAGQRRRRIKRLILERVQLKLWGLREDRQNWRWVDNCYFDEWVTKPQPSSSRCRDSCSILVLLQLKIAIRPNSRIIDQFCHIPRSTGNC